MVHQVGILIIGSPDFQGRLRQILGAHPAYTLSFTDEQGIGGVVCAQEPWIIFCEAGNGTNVFQILLGLRRKFPPAPRIVLYHREALGDALTATRVISPRLAEQAFLWPAFAGRVIFLIQAILQRRCFRLAVHAEAGVAHGDEASS